MPGRIKKTKTNTYNTKKTRKYINRKSQKNTYIIPFIPKRPHTPNGTPKVALLFLTKGEHEQSALWKTLLNYPTFHEMFSIYCHPAIPNYIQPDSFLRKTTKQSPFEGLLPKGLCIPRPHNRWGHLVLAYYQLLHRAYSDTYNNNQRFVYLSETCVPCVNAQCAYKLLMTNLNATYMDAPRPNDNNDRYEQVVHKPWLSMWPSKVNPNSKKITSLDCSVELQRAGILKDQFFKHSGWFSPNRQDTFRLLQHQRSFEALNLISAGDEHILSILRNPEYTTQHKLKQHRITFVQWDWVKIQEWEALKNDEAYWKKDDKLKRTNHKLYQQMKKEREVMKNANMHPVEYIKKFTTKQLKNCVDAKSVFVRKVRQSCNVDVLLQHILQD